MADAFVTLLLCEQFPWKLILLHPLPRTRTCCDSAIRVQLSVTKSREHDPPADLLCLHAASLSRATACSDPLGPCGSFSPQRWTWWQRNLPAGARRRRSSRRNWSENASSDFSWKRSRTVEARRGSVVHLDRADQGGSRRIRAEGHRVLCSLVGRGRVLRGFVSAAGLRVACVSVMVETAVATLTAILFTSFDIQAKVHQVSLHFVSIVLSNVEESTDVVDRLQNSVCFSVILARFACRKQPNPRWTFPTLVEGLSK